jgi:hypothetical protein
MELATRMARAARQGRQERAGNSQTSIGDPNECGAPSGGIYALQNARPFPKTKFPVRVSNIDTT